MLRDLAILLLSIELVSAAIHVRNGRIVDDLGAELLFHGLNLVSKVPPYITHFSEKDMRYFQELGINGIRLGVMWPGVEPRKGQFNETYLQLMRQTVEDAAKFRIFTLVEFHQDLFSEKFCADGVPIWAIPSEIYQGFPRPLNVKKYKWQDNGYPKWTDCSKHPWSEYYFTNAVAKAFGALWTNKHGMRDLFIRYWQKVASTFKGSPHVIAYELINEPWPGDQFRNPLVMVPGLSEVFHLQHSYDLIAEAIRKVDPDHSICFEPVTWLNYFRAGFSHPPGGKRHANNSILCYHYYQPPTFNLKKFMKARMKDTARLGVGGLLSEFYVINQAGEKNVEMMNACDENLQSWFGWIYDINSTLSRQQQSQDLRTLLFNHNGQPTELVKGVTRTYAPRVAGVTISQKYDPITHKFELVYEACTTCGQTSIFVSSLYIYTKGFQVRCYPSDGLHWTQDGPHHIKVIASHIRANTRVSVTITAL